MTNSALEENELVAMITKAFAGVEYPGDDHLVYDPDDPEAEELAEFLKRKRRSEITPPDMLSSVYPIGFLTPEALHYYLPAFMTLCIKEYDECDIAHDFLIYTLTPPAADETATNLLPDLARRVSWEQAAAIAAFLQYVKRIHGGVKELGPAAEFWGAQADSKWNDSRR